MKTLKKTAYTLTMLAFATGAYAQAIGEDCGCPDLSARTTVNMSSLTDANGNLPASATNLTCDNLYVIDEKVHVPDGGDLFIEPGTVLKGAAGVGSAATALVVNRGGQIWANGNSVCPIIFTSTADPVDGTHSMDLTGEWGGVIVLGRASNNIIASNSLGVDDGLAFVEGIAPVIAPATIPNDARYYYGADLNNGETFDDADNSGVLRYVSIRHGGTLVDVNDPNGNDLNGLTCGSVGSGTTFEYIEVVANFDDGIEFFGGTCDLKNAVVQFVGDDFIDHDHGWSGRVQYALLVNYPNGTEEADNGLECDGDDGNTGLPGNLSDPQYYNITIIGEGDSDKGYELKDNTQGTYANSIISGYPSAIQLEDGAANQAYENWAAGSLEIFGTRFQGATNYTVTRANAGALSAADQATFDGDDNIAVASDIIDASFAMSGVVVSDPYNPVPLASHPNILPASLPPMDGFFDQANFVGAFEPGAEPWTAGWTVSSAIGADASLVDCPEDINGDAQIDVNDFILLNAVFGTSCQ